MNASKGLILCCRCVEFSTKSIRNIFPEQPRFVVKRFFATNTYKLIEIGKLQDCIKEPYESGRLFVHKIFGYRGLILFPWKTKLYDYDQYYANVLGKKSGEETFNGYFTSKPPLTDVESKAAQIYYQVLIDERDWPDMLKLSHILYINLVSPYVESIQKRQKDDMCIWKKQDLVPQTNPFSLAGIGDASHEEILPYMPTETEAFKHPNLPKFFGINTDQYGTQHLQSWRNICLQFLKFSSIYRRTTQNIRITVIPYYLGFYHESQGGWVDEAGEKHRNHVWRYSIRLENFGKERVVLREREWEIVDIDGRKETLKGRGVVGMEPHLTRSEPAFQYSSFIYLRAPGGTMSGSYTMQRDDGTLFRCTIPLFELRSVPNS